MTYKGLELLKIQRFNNLEELPRYRGIKFSIEYSKLSSVSSISLIASTGTYTEEIYSSVFTIPEDIRTLTFDEAKVAIERHLQRELS